MNENTKPKLVNLSPHFTVQEFNHSDTAVRLNIKNEMSVNQAVIATALCENVLEKVRAHFNSPVVLSSGYRGPQLNRKIGGSSSSAHMILKTAAAADFTVIGHKNQEVFDWIRANLEFDQVILEGVSMGGTGGWIHCAWDIKHNRKQAMKATFRNGVPNYVTV